jgi:hypothetical protein
MPRKKLVLCFIEKKNSERFDKACESIQDTLNRVVQLCPDIQLFNPINIWEILQKGFYIPFASVRWRN